MDSQKNDQESSDHSELLQSYLNSNLNSRVVFLSQLPPKITYLELHAICSKYGEVHELIYPLIESGKAFCIFCKWKSATKIVNEKDDKVLEHATIKIIKQQGIYSKILVYSSLLKNSKINFDDIKGIMSKYGKIENSFEITQGQWIINYYNIKNAIKCEQIHKIVHNRETLYFCFFKTSKDLYDELKKTQVQLCCERAMRSVELYSKDQYIRNAVTNQISLFTQEKNYFLKFLCIFSSISEFVEQPQIGVEEVIFHTEPLIIHDFPFLDQLFDKLLENNGRKFSDSIFNLLSFSLIPALTNYFTIDFNLESSKDNQDPNIQNFKSNYYITALNKLISKLKEETDNQDYIAIIYKALFTLIIPMFASPYFIAFNRETFLPVFSELQVNIIDLSENQIDEQIDKSINKLKTTIENNAHLVPPFIANAMNLLHQQTYFLKKCFLDLAFKNPNNAIAYSLFHFSKPPTEELLKKIYNKLIEKSFCDKLLTCFGISFGFRYMYQLNGKLENSLLTKQYKKSSTYYYDNEMIQYQFKQIFQTCILSQTDLDLIKYILTSDGLDPFKPSKKAGNEKIHQVFLIFKTKEDQQFIETVFGVKNKDENIDMHQTMINAKDMFAPQLRHLLQNSDPLPNLIDDSDINKMDAIKLLHFIEERGAINKHSVRKWNCDYLKSYLCHKTHFVQIQYLSNLLPNTLLEQLDEIETLTSISHIKERTNNINVDILFRPLQKLSAISKVVFLELNPKIKNKLVFRNTAEYLANPDLFLNDFKSNLFDAFNLRDNQKVDENAAILLEMLEIIKSEQNKRNPKNKIPQYYQFYREFTKFYNENNIDDKKFDEKYNFNIQNNFDEIFNECIENHIREKYRKKKKRHFTRTTAENNIDEDEDINITNIEKKDDDEFNEEIHFLEKFNLLRNHNDEINNFSIKSFREPSIFKLVENIETLISGFLLYFKDGWRGNEFGAEELAIFIPLSILLCKPPNISFLCQFVLFFQNSSDFCFNECLITTQSCLLQTKMVYDYAAKSLEKKKKKGK